MKHDAHQDYAAPDSISPGIPSGLTFCCGIIFGFLHFEGTMRNKYLHAKTPNIIPQKVGDALGDYPRQFRTYLESREYSPDTVRDYIRSINALGTLMQEHEMTLADLDEAEAVKLFS